MRFGADVLLQDVDDDLSIALDDIQKRPEFVGRKVYDDMKVTAITAADYNAYQRLAKPDAPLAPLPSTKLADIEVRQLPAVTPTWEFHLLGDLPRELVKLEVVTYDDPSAKPVTLTLQHQKPDDPLTLTQLGSYAASRRPDKRPIKYTTYIRGLMETGEGKPVSGDWPKGDNFYLIRLNGFRGDLKVLQATITNPALVPNGPETFDIQNNFTLALGEAKQLEDVAEGIDIEGNKLYVTAPKLHQGNPKRAYLLFPLAKEEFDKQLPAAAAERRQRPARVDPQERDPADDGGGGHAGLEAGLVRAAPGGEVARPPAQERHLRPGAGAGHGRPVQGQAAGLPKAAEQLPGGLPDRRLRV